MSEHDASDPPEPELVEAETLEAETVDGLPVLAEVREVAPARVRTLAPAAQTAAAAATGFLAGAATLALLRRYGVRRVANELQGVRGPADPWRRPPEPFPFRPGNTYLVTVRVVPRPPE